MAPTNGGSDWLDQLGDEPQQDMPQQRPSNAECQREVAWIFNQLPPALRDPLRSYWKSQGFDPYDTLMHAREAMYYVTLEHAYLNLAALVLAREVNEVELNDLDSLNQQAEEVIRDLEASQGTQAQEILKKICDIVRGREAYIRDGWLSDLRRNSNVNDDSKALNELVKEGDKLFKEDSSPAAPASQQPVRSSGRSTPRRGDRLPTQQPAPPTTTWNPPGFNPHYNQQPQRTRDASNGRAVPPRPYPNGAPGQRPNPPRNGGNQPQPRGGNGGNSGQPRGSGRSGRGDR